MEINQLRYFCAVVETGNFTKAADLAGVSQPSLSQQVRRLEKSMGADLLIRQSRSIRLTHAGTVLYPYAKQILKQAKQATAHVRQLETDLCGPLRIGVIPTVLPYLIAPHIGEFSRSHPEIEVSLTEDLSGRLVELLKATDLDLIVVSLPLRDQDLVCGTLMQDPLVLVTPANHKLVSLQALGHLDLSGERLILLKQGHCFRENMLTACKRNGSEMAPVFESDHFGSIFPLVAANSGITIAPLMAARHATDCAISPLPKPQARRVGYARLKSSADFKPVSVFVKWLRSLSAGFDAKV